MAGNQLAISNIVNISVSASQAGAGDYNTSNLGMFSHEAYDPASFGTSGYKRYLSPTDVAEDFGSGSIAYAQANAVFSQQPNILAGRGALLIIPITPESQTITPSGIAASGVFVLNYGGNPTASINWNDTATQVQTKLRAVTGLEGVIVSGTIAAGLTVKFLGIYGDVSLLTVSGNTLETSGSVAITLTVATSVTSETLAQAITRTVGLVQYFGVMGSMIFSQSDMLAAAAVVQPLNKIAGFVSRTAVDVDPGGMLDLLRSGSFYKSRGLFYGTDSDLKALVMLASYLGRGFSVDFSGSNTTFAMHLKDLIGIDADPSMTETLYAKCQDAGADVYVSFQGVSKVACSGANKFFDQVYNQEWFVGALQIAGFNYLAQSATKVVQTEQGMDGLKKAYRDVCEQAVVNQYAAGGTWNDPTTFGNQLDFLANVLQRGYYIFSSPIAKQSQTQRAARIAPLVQIALKEAGAFHSSNVIVNINP